jgi:hypothetical protein
MSEKGKSSETKEEEEEEEGVVTMHWPDFI